MPTSSFFDSSKLELSGRLLPLAIFLPDSVGVIMPWTDQVRKFGQISDRFENYKEILIDREIRLRIFSKDASVWHDIIESSESANHCMDWTDSLKQAMSVVSQVPSPLRNRGSVMLIGTGGASLSAKAYTSVFQNPTETNLQVLDSTSPKFLGTVFNEMVASERYYVVSSKSGSTIETLDIARSLFDRVGCPDRFYTVTDPRPSQLRKWAEANAIAIYPSDPFVPGRFSSLSTLGLFPLKILGYDLQQIQGAYREFTESISDDESSISLAVIETAAMLAVLASEPGSRLVLSAGLNLLPVLQWTEQIVSESLGKFGFGILPVIELYQTEDQPSNRVQVRVRLGESELGLLIDEKLNDLRQIARYFLFWQTVISMTGYNLGINPFDQPNVERSKRNVQNALQDSNSEISKIKVPYNSVDGSWQSVETLRTVLQQIKDNANGHDYICFLTFVDPDMELFQLMTRWTQRTRELTGLTTVINIGPQYLHSTGQFHKGGPKTGHYMVIGVEESNDIQVSDRTYTFGKLIKIQLYADMEVLRRSERPVHYFQVKNPVLENLRTMLELL